MLELLLLKESKQPWCRELVAFKALNNDLLGVLRQLRVDQLRLGRIMVAVASLRSNQKVISRMQHVLLGLLEILVAPSRAMIGARLRLSTFAPYGLLIEGLFVADCLEATAYPPLVGWGRLDGSGAQSV